MWMIQKVAVDEAGHISSVQWQRVDTSTNSWVGMARVAPLIEVVDAVTIGRVGSVFPAPNGNTVQGPYVRTFVHGNSKEEIVADTANGETRSLLDLPRL